MTPDDLLTVERSWSDLRAEWLLAAVEELVGLLSAPSQLAAHARDVGETWPDPCTAPSFGVEGRAWMDASRECSPSWNDRTEASWCQAWLLLSDVLAAEALSPFADGDR